MSQLPDRYPGIKAFEKNEANLFKGREQEVEELFNLVTAENCVVLFGKSGLGKSSLLNAGLSPMLEARGFLPIPVRLQPSGEQDAQTPASIFRLNIKAYAGRIKCESAPGEDPGNLPLWEYLKTCVFPMGFVPVFILDQFENFFTHNSRKDQEAFLLSLKELLHNEVPVRILNWYKTIPAAERTREQVAWCNQPGMRVIISLREDRLGDLGFVSAYVLHVLRSRYQLLPLTVEQAERAITVPAQQTDRQYASLPFKISDGAKELILKKLGSGKNTVETTHLQLICHEIECKRKDPPYSAIEPLEVTEDFFEGEQGLNDIINNFYARQIRSIINDIQREKAKMLLETKMVQNGKRVLYSEDQVNLVLGDDALQIISRLLDLRLLRGDYRDERKIYEISHDSLLAPILAANKDREEQEKEVKRQKEITEQQERIIKLQKQARLKRKATLLAWGCGILSVIIIVLGLFLLIEKRDDNFSFYKSTMDYAGRYYRDNDHYTSFALFNALYNTSDRLKDTIKEVLDKTFFYDVSGGSQMEVMNDSTFAVYNKDETMFLWKTSSNETVTPLFIGMAMEGTMTTSYPYIAYRGSNGDAIAFNIKTNQRDTLPKAMKFEPQEIRSNKSPLSKIEKKEEPNDLFFLKGAPFLVTTNAQNDVLAYDLTKKKMILLSNKLVHDTDSFFNPVEDIQLSTDGNWLAVRKNNEIITWDISNPDKPFPADSIVGASIMRTNDYGLLIYAQYRQLYIKKTGMAPSMLYVSSEEEIELSPDGKNLMYIDANQQIRVFSLTQNRLLPFSYPGLNINQDFTRSEFFPNRLVRSISRPDYNNGYRATISAVLPSEDGLAILYFNTAGQVVLNRSGNEIIVQDSGRMIATVGASPSLDKIIWPHTSTGTLTIQDVERNKRYIIQVDKPRQRTAMRFMFNSTGKYLAFMKNDSALSTIVYDIMQQKEIYEVPYSFNGFSFFNYPFLQVNMDTEKTGLVHYNTKLKGLDHYRSWFGGQKTVANRFGLNRRKFLNIF